MAADAALPAAEPGTRPVVFVSDVHLYYGGDAYLRQFVAFLDDVGSTASRLYIHGDLFDFYVGPRQGARPFYAPLFDALGRLVAAGVEVAVVHGNRDFLMGRRFEACGVRVLPPESTLELGGRRVHLSHGDQFCIHDLSYRFWARGVLRTLPIRWLVRSLPVGLSFWAARRYRGVSNKKRRRLEARDTGRLPSILDGVQRLLDRDFHDVVICGHIHHLAETPLEAAGRSARLLTTGAWEEGPNYIAFDGGDFRIRPFEPR